MSIAAANSTHLGMSSWGKLFKVIFNCLVLLDDTVDPDFNNSNRGN
jgi:hypothetical protein